MFRRFLSAVTVLTAARTSSVTFLVGHDDKRVWDGQREIRRYDIFFFFIVEIIVEIYR